MNDDTYEEVVTFKLTRLSVYIGMSTIFVLMVGFTIALLAFTPLKYYIPGYGSAQAGREYLEVTVPPYPNPISYRGEYYYRSGSTNQALRGAALDRFLLRRQGRHWDGVPVPGAAVSDLDANAFAGFRRQAARSQRLSGEVLDEPDADLLNRLRLQENSYLKRAALLLFHADPERFVTGAFIKIGYFESNVDLRYQDEVHGDLFSQVARTIEILKAKYLKAWISYDGLQRVESWPVPEPALREAILNAVVHRDYASAVPTQISVYPDRLMIWNPGQLPPDWTVQSLLDKHPSEPFNPEVANAFFRAGLIEAWGRGIERMVQACTGAGLPEPVLRQEPTGLWTVFHFAGGHTESPEESGKTTHNTTPKTTQERILALLRSQPSLTRRELAARTGISPDGVKYHLDRLRVAGAIRRIGSSRVGHWEVLR